MPDLGLEQVIALSKDAIEQIGSVFEEPDEDWLPTMVVLTAEDKLGLVGIDPEFLSNQLTKQVLAEQIIPSVLREQHAVAASFISSAWMAQGDAMGMMKLRPAQHPDRQECVMLTVATAFEARSMTALIIRHEDKPPTLGEWSEFPDPEGLFPEALRHGLARQG